MATTFRMFRFIGCIVLFLVLATFTNAQDVYTDDDLQGMSMEALEEICVVRGFEILKDEIDTATGLPYELTHDDYVEAARKCLEIEAEMNELLAEHPELAAELEEEIKKMEAEQAARLAEVEELEQKLAETEAMIEAKKEDTPDSAAFVSSPTESDGTATEEASDESSRENEEVNGHASIISTEEETEESTDSTSNAVEDTATTQEGQLETTNTTKEDFTVKAIGVEVIRAMMKQVESDIRRIVELMIPVLQPLLRAGDQAWQRIRSAFDKFRQDYEARQAQHQETETEAETETETTEQ